MYYDKEKYEELILNSPLFTLDKEACPSLYEREKYRMNEYLYCYLMAINEKRYEPYGVEIFKVSNECIRCFDESKGIFLHYFNAAWKQECHHINGKKILDERLSGIKGISQKDRSLIVKLMNYREKKKTDEDVFALI